MQPALNVTRVGLLLLAALASPLHAADVGVLTPASRHLRIILVGARLRQSWDSELSLPAPPAAAPI